MGKNVYSPNPLPSGERIDISVSPHTGEGVDLVPLTKGERGLCCFSLHGGCEKKRKEC